MKNLPSEFLERMRTLLSDEFDDFISSINKDPIRSFRVNTDQISIDDFERINIF
jgi:16S rRNA C967 or C1407 C5-methylase (RsmB/RsmF family)